MSYLHVLNGDATLTPFRQSGIPGQVVVCREMMCEGKVKYTKDMDAFFSTRAKHLEFHYGIDQQTYKANVVKELEKLKTAGGFDEIVLWFEFDLFCQINLLFILHYLHTQVEQLPQLSLVCINQHADIPVFRGMGMLSAQHFPPLLEKRVALQNSDMLLAASTWEAYSKGDPLAMEKIAHNPTGNFPFLGNALLAHLQRLPNTENGLNVIQSYFLRKLAWGEVRWYDLYGQFWREMKIFGFGDFQLDISIQRLRSAGMITQHDQMLALTGLGRDVLNNEENYTDYVGLHHRWLGGIRLENCPWRWDNKNQKVIAVNGLQPAS